MKGIMHIIMKDRAIIVLLALVLVFSLAENSVPSTDSAKLVEEVNKNDHGWKAAHNKFSYMSMEGKRRYISKSDFSLNLSPPPEFRREGVVTDTGLPDSYDPRTLPWFHPVRDQAQCGSCWAFSSVEALADRTSLNGTTCPVLSVQNLLSCTSTEVFCCGGATLGVAWNFLSNTGVVSESCFQYSSASGTCNPTDCPIQPGDIICPDEGTSSLHKSENMHWLVDEFGMKYHLYHFGPLQVAFNVYADFYHYSDGVYTHVSGGMDGGHAVEMVGWGVEGGVPFWLVKNSWGDWWGDNGYFKIRRGVNECKIEKPYYSLASGFLKKPGVREIRNVVPATVYGGESVTIFGTDEVFGTTDDTVKVTVGGKEVGVKEFGRIKKYIRVRVGGSPKGGSGQILDGDTGGEILKLGDSSNPYCCAATFADTVTLKFQAPSELYGTYFLFEYMWGTPTETVTVSNAKFVVFDAVMGDFSVSITHDIDLMHAPHYVLTEALPSRNDTGAVDLVLQSTQKGMTVMEKGVLYSVRSPSSGGGGGGSGAGVVIGIIVGVLVIIGVVVAIVWYRKRADRAGQFQPLDRDSAFPAAHSHAAPTYGPQPGYQSTYY